MSEKLSVVIHVLLNLITRITNKTRRATMLISSMIRSSFFWRSIYAISLLFLWAWLANSFWTLLSFWKSSGYIATGMVILGVVGESISEFGNFSQDDEGKKRRDALGKLSSLVLIAGLAIELFCAVRTTELSYEIVADLQQESSSTFKAAGAAIERASSALLEQERLKSENLKLEALIQPRSLSLERQRAIGKALRAFKGRNVIIAAASLNDPESYNLSQQIFASVKAAKLDAELSASRPGGRQYSAITETGVQVRWPSPDQQDLGIAIGRALRKIGSLQNVSVVQGGTAVSLGTNLKGEFVEILVLPKPFDVLPQPPTEASRNSRNK